MNTPAANGGRTRSQLARTSTVAGSDRVAAASAGIYGLAIPGTGAYAKGRPWVEERGRGRELSARDRDALNYPRSVTAWSCLVMDRDRVERDSRLSFPRDCSVATA